MPRIDVATVTLGWLGRAAPLLVAVLLLLLLLPAASVAAGGSTGGPANEGRSSGELLSVGAGYGDQGGSEGVRELQVRLRGAGYEPGPIDGLFGPLTRAAVQGFQRAHGLATDGVVGPQTAEGLRRATIQAGVQPVRVIQRQLHALGYEPGPVDGVYGPLTAAAVERFQRAEGLAVNGVPGSQTAARLEAARAALVREPVERAAGPAPADTARRAPGEAPPDRPRASTLSGAESSSSADPSSPFLRPGYLALLAALALALVLTGVRARRRERTPAPTAKPVATSRVGARFNPGVACALLLGGLVVGAAGGALFATQASPDDGAAATANSLLSRAGELRRPAAARAERPASSRSERPERRPVARARAASATRAAPATTKAPATSAGPTSAPPLPEQPAVGTGEAFAAAPARPAERPGTSAPDRDPLVADIVRAPAGGAGAGAAWSR
jgi:peptidoglycan hydrolase-like protein with peptidoglycan-binding domain